MLILFQGNVHSSRSLCKRVQSCLNLSTPPPPHTHTLACVCTFTACFILSHLGKAMVISNMVISCLCRTLWWYRNTEHHNWCDHGKAFQSRRCPVIRECLFLLKPYFQPLCHAQVFPLRLILPPSLIRKKMLRLVGLFWLICRATAIIIRTMKEILKNVMYCMLYSYKHDILFFLNSWYCVIKYRIFLVIFSAISTFFF